MRSAFRPAWSAAPALIALIALGGCSQGESIPVEPVGVSLDATPDPFFLPLAPLCADRQQYDCAQLEDGTACIVGEEGMILERNPRGTWYRAASPTGNNLRRVYAGPDGRFWALGDGGVVVVRDAGGWRLEETGHQGDLNEIWADGSEVWAVGDAGTVLRRSGGSWALLDCPTEADLTGVSGDAEARYVCGPGVMLRYAAGIWTDESDGPWMSSRISSVVCTEGGQTVAAAGYDLYRRTEAGWRLCVRPESLFYSRIVGLRTDADSIWLESGGWPVRAAVQDSTWTGNSVRSSSGSGSTFRIGPAAGRDALLISSAGDVDWIGADDVPVPDPIGRPGSTPRFFEFADGTCGFVDNRGLFWFEDGRLHSRRLDYGEYGDDDPNPVHIEGLSLDDFFVSEARNLFHLVDGALDLALELEFPMNGRTLAVGAEGDLFVLQDFLLYRLAPGARALEPQEEMGDASYYVRRLRSGRIVVWGGGQVFYRDEGIWTPSQLEIYPEYIWEAGDGVMGAYNEGSSWYHYTTLHFWREGSASVSAVCSLVPGNSAIQARACRSAGTGFYVTTYEPCRIFRLDDTDPVAGRWDAVTGLFPGYISNFLPLQDGSLLVNANWSNHLFLYRDRSAD